MAQYINIHTHRPTGNPDVHEIVNVDIGCPLAEFSSVGIHPWHTSSMQVSDWDWVVHQAHDHRVVMIGETGIDRLRGADVEVQTEVFRRHVQLSEQLCKPLIIHCVKAFDIILHEHAFANPKQRWIIHGFRGKPQLAQQLLNAGMELSFGLHHNPDSLVLAKAAGAAWFETDDQDFDIRELYT